MSPGSGLRSRALRAALAVLGIVIGAAALGTLLPATAETTASLFGLDLVVWFTWTAQRHPWPYSRKIPLAAVPLAPKGGAAGVCLPPGGASASVAGASRPRGSGSSGRVRSCSVPAGACLTRAMFSPTQDAEIGTAL